VRNQGPKATFYAGTGRLQCYSLALTAPQTTAEQIAFLCTRLASDGLPADANEATHPTQRLCELAIDAHAALLHGAGFFFPESAQIVRADPASGKFTVAVPKIPTGGELSSSLFAKLINLFAGAASGSTGIDGSLKAIRHELAETPRNIPTAAHIARAAYELEMPLIEWRQPFLQIGYGKNAIVVSGSITQSSPSIGVHYAREKSWTNALLADAGIPVAEGVLVKSVAEARAKAAALGYPVVIKPADRDGGTAVSSGIAGPAEIDQAFTRAREASEKVLLEKHIDGLDYRLLFFGDELLLAIERTPGGVTGNGRDNIQQLLDTMNAERLAAGSLLYELTFDDEAQIMLDRQGLTRDSVLEDGRFAPLRRAANHALGGSVRVAEDIHPDNLDIARRAMRLLRLDIAGLDLILPDIAKSWHETGGVVCEINAQPFIGDPVGRDFYREILARIVPHGGRIPLVLVVGTLDSKTVAALVKRIPGLAVTDGSGTVRNGRPLAPKGTAWAPAAQAALYDQETTAGLCQLDPTQPIPVLSPVDRFAAAFVLEIPEAGVTAPLAALLGRAMQVHALKPLSPALKKAGLKSKPIEQAEIAAALAAVLAGAPRPAAAKPKSAPRGTAPPASRTRR
jgi:cyanophycin synthetase